MEFNTITSGALALLGISFGIIGWLLNRKDIEQDRRFDAKETQIMELFRLHNADALKLHELELQVVGHHYEKPEVDTKIAELRDTLRGGFTDLGEKFDKLSERLVQHMIQSGEGK